MLHALAHQKSRKISATSMCEDEITSTFFGPLEYMSSSEVWRILRRLKLIDIEGSAEDFEPTSHRVEFWAKYANPSASGSHWRRCEPDVIFRFHGKDGSRYTLIVEVKWHARTSSRDMDGVSDQLARQWVAVRSKSLAAETVKHVYLTQRALEATEGLNETLVSNVAGFDADEWIRSAKACTWADLAARLSVLADGSDKAHSWAAAALAFLVQLNIVPFTAFKNLEWQSLISVQPFTVSGRLESTMTPSSIGADE